MLTTISLTYLVWYLITRLVGGIFIGATHKSFRSDELGFLILLGIPPFVGDAFGLITGGLGIGMAISNRINTPKKPKEISCG